MRLPASLSCSLVLALAAFLSGCGGGRAQSCNSNLDCSAPQVCTAGLCANPGCSGGVGQCSSDAQCGAGHCAGGCCTTGAPGSCHGDVDCLSHPATPVCDTANDTCVQCLTARDCGSGKLCTNQLCVAQPGCGSNTDCKDPTLPVCDGSARVCVQCLKPADCKTAAAPNCDLTHHCVGASGCTSDAQCTAPTPRCVVGTGKCAVCISDTDCKAGQQCSPSHTCLTPASSCTSDKQCTAPVPHCTSTGVAPGICVQCTADSQCPAGDTCGTSDTCAPKQCAGDADCAGFPSTPRCNTAASPHVCVACLGNGDCPAQSTCQAGNTCSTPPAQCMVDTDCKTAGLPRCDTATSPHACVACLAASDCKSGQVCTAQNTCATTRCASNGDCAKPTAYCNPSGTCVACTLSAQCPAGDKCGAQETCVPVCTTATQSTDCAAPTALCKVSPGGNSCVQCLANTDCPSGDLCSSGNTCIAAPPPGCQSNADCPPGAHVCDASQSPPACVQCLATSDCPSPDVCDAPTKTCVVPPAGADGQACRSDLSCNSGLICVAEQAGDICRTLCDPYAAGTCASESTASVCEWFGFDTSGTFSGFCEPKSGQAAEGAACNPTQGGCEWNLFCAPSSAATGVCETLCDPSTGSCDGALTCNPLVGALDAQGNPLSLGVCGAAVSKWGAACATDSGPAGPDCGSPTTAGGTGTALYCTPSTLPAENPISHIAGLCLFTPAVSTATGGAGASCANVGGNACRTGLCLLDGPATCFADCRYGSDCSRDGASADYCLDVAFVATDFAGNVARGIVPSCQPTCVDDAGCPVGGAGRSCQPQPTHSGSAWVAACAPVFGAGKAGAQCVHGTDCNSGRCATAATLLDYALGLAPAVGFAPTDGFCLGACDATQPADCASGTACNTLVALPLQPINDSHQGVVGWPGPSASSGVCFGGPGASVSGSCQSDADCNGLSLDPATPRVCAPYKLALATNTDLLTDCASDADCVVAPIQTCNSSANNPNPSQAYGANAGIYGPNAKCRGVSFGLQCAPSLGSSLGGGGDPCSTPTACQSGHCATSGGAGFCFAPCATDADCHSGTHCTSGSAWPIGSPAPAAATSYLGIATSFCQ